MRFLKVSSLVALVSLAGTVAHVYGQGEKRGEHQQEQRAQPPRQAQPQRQQQQRAQQPPQQAQPQRQQQQQRAQRPQQQAQPERQHGQPNRPLQTQEQPKQYAQRPQQRGYAPPQRTRQQAQSWQQQSGWRQQDGWQGQSTWQQARSSHWESDHRTWSQRGGYGGYYIPQNRFGLYFGPEHWFRIRRQPIIVGGYPRFQYGGFWFMMLDPWPEYWSDNWYANDDVYVGYDDGYYLYNRRYPGNAIALTVAL